MKRLLDVFSGAGGCSEGYRRAGFTPYGIDNDPKPLRHYPFPYICMDALEAMDRLLKGEGLTFSNGETLYLADFAAFHASPPCQGYSIMRNLPWLREKTYPLLIVPVREMLLATDKLYVIENVMGAKLAAGWLCGGMFGLPFYRHRAFETSFFWLQPGHPKHQTIIQAGRNFGDRGHRSIGVQGCVGNGAQRVGANIGHRAGAALARNIMSIDWMNRDELTQAIPPSYTEYIGKWLMKAIEEAK